MKAIPTPTAHATTYTVSSLPLDHPDVRPFAVTVERTGPGDRWAVFGRVLMCLDATGEWDWEPSPSERDDEWETTHRFPLDEALTLARAAALTLKVNGNTVADVLARDGR